MTTSENSTLDSPLQNFTSRQRETLQRLMRDTYETFLRGASEGRHLDVKAVDRIAQGRIWTGEHAKQLGLVDELGGLHTAIALAKDLAKIPRSEKVGLVYLPPSRTLLEKILDLVGGARELSPAAALREWLAQIESLARAPVWAVLPGVPEAE